MGEKGGIGREGIDLMSIVVLRRDESERNSMEESFRVENLVVVSR